jgi:hypothetical protein
VGLRCIAAAARSSSAANASRIALLPMCRLRAVPGSASGSTEAERECHLDAEVARTGVAGGPDERRDSDDEERLARSGVYRLSEDVDEDRDGEDRTAAADQAEQRADRQPEWEG